MIFENTLFYEEIGSDTYDMYMRKYGRNFPCGADDCTSPVTKVWFRPAFDDWEDDDGVMHDGKLEPSMACIGYTCNNHEPVYDNPMVS